MKKTLYILIAVVVGRLFFKRSFNEILNKLKSSLKDVRNHITAPPGDVDI
jgi:hypothetical protein